MTRKLQIGIVGYGIAGIAAAIHLRNQGHCITHFDRSKSPGALGAGMLLHPPAIRQLNQLGVSSSALSCGAPVRRIRAQTMRGRPIIDFCYGDLAAGSFGLGIQRAALHELLSHLDTGKDQLRSDHKIVSADQHCGTMYDESGNCHGPFDLIVVADGTNSLIREKLNFPVRHDRRSESAALVGLLNDPHTFAADALTQYFDGTRHLSIWPVGCTLADNQRRCSIAINVPLADAGAFRDLGIWREVATRLCPGIQELIASEVTDAYMHIFSYRHIELEQLTAGRVVLLGDAAHSMSPQLGNGAHLAMEDASILASFIARNADVNVALREFSRSRVDQLRSYHRASRWITPVFQSENNLLAMFRDNMLANAMLFPGVKRLVHALLD
ncbi:MAG TPA: NAD(P)/FAD-dependent oxidoreductase [Steroidobacteraceae bacterium]|jgi:2-polyprenyl-6-methoxyphenol hydroxylase-like FAD-dependent oxidoreductase|nr:NAD(P)/FAD-dependent oxidoreductase [Steroidobacteraceae bacterium]